MTESNNLSTLVEFHLDLAKASQDGKIPALIAILLVNEKKILIQKKGNETFYNIQYDLITQVVFTQNCIIQSNALISLQELVENELRKSLTSRNSDLAIREANNAQRDHIIECYKKIVQHIHLAYIQKKFILEAAQNAKLLAENAHQLSIESLQKSHDALTNANNAKETALSTSQSITTQFVTILGIFATIIVALFGGMSLVRATVDLLMKEGSLPKFAFIISVLMLCFVSLIGLLISWVSAINTKKDDKYQLYKGIIFMIFATLLSVSGIAMHMSKDNQTNVSRTNNSEAKVSINIDATDKKTPQ